ncbi:MAG: outer membrane beta-barrel family protein [Bacteroidota bacterium]
MLRLAATHAARSRRDFFLFATTFALLLAPNGWAQDSGLISGTIATLDDEPLGFANVQLLVASDSSFVQGAVSTDDGAFAMASIPAGEFLLFVSLIGYEDLVTPLFVMTRGQSYDAGTLTLEPGTFQIDEIAVEARRTLYEQRGDRMVVNVGQSVTLKGATALDVVARSPGVVVNQQSNTISMLGKDGVQVLIDGKLSYIPADGLVAFLEGLNADSIEQIELITTPPAEFDAEGNAGFINLVLKEQLSDGLSGSTTITGGFGDGAVANTSADARLRQGRITLFGNASFLWNGQDQTFRSYLETQDGASLLATPTESTREPVRRNFNGRLGIDYALSERTTVGGLVAGYDNRWSMDAVNQSAVSIDGNPMTQIVSANEEVNHWQHLMGNVNVRHELASGLRTSLDLDVLRFENDNPTTYLNTTTDVPNDLTTEETLESGKTTPLRIYVAKVDVGAPDEAQVSWNAGVKGGFSRFTNTPVFPENVDTDWVGDVGVGEESSLRENVLAAYGSVNLQLTEKTAAEVGLRYEHTTSDLESADGRQLIDRSYGDVFPSVYLSHQLRDELTLSASYARRITRPTFNDMAPFIYFLSPTTFFTGSTALQPAISDALKADVTVGSIFASVEYAWVTDPIARFQSRVIPEANVQVSFPTNFDRQRTATALLAAPIEVRPWWTTQNTATVTWLSIEGEREGRDFESAQTSYSLSTTHNVRLPVDFSLEASAFYQSAGLFGAIEFDPVWGVNLGLQREIPGLPGSLTFAVDDVFDTVEWSVTQRDDAVPFFAEGFFDFAQRTFRLTYTRPLGAGPGSQARATASEEESRRVE